MNSWQQLLVEYPMLQTILDGALVIIPLASLLAYCGIFFLSATAKIIAISRKRSAYDKCSRQSALLGLILGWSLLIGARVWLYYIRSDYSPEELVGFMLEMSWLLLSLGTLFSSIYYCFWRILKNMPVLHSTLGVISAVQNCIALVSILFTARLLSVPGAPKATDGILALPSLFPHALDSPLWSAACYTLPLIFAMAGAITCCWLVIRRKRDDFGRDYYSQMLAWCAAWARNGWALVWFLLLVSVGLRFWLSIATGSFDNEECIFEACRLLFWLIPILLWTWVKVSRVPLRQSWAIFLGFIFACLFMLPYYLELTSA